MSVATGGPTAHDANDAAWHRHYSAAPVVGGYRRHEELQAPEVSILALLRGELPAARLLDVGVGGGRTALHLAGICHDYLGVDYSAAMVDACHARFAKASWYAPGRFRQADARALPFDDESFDIVFFSFNGLDHVPTPERATALAECRRVLRRGGWFIHSGHNLNWLDGEGLLPRSRGWGDWVDQYRHLRLMKRLNDGVVQTIGVDAADLRDPPDGLLLHYARPVAHLRELQAAGLTGARVFDGRGRELTGTPRATSTRDTWVYYLSRRPATAG